MVSHVRGNRKKHEKKPENNYKVLDWDWRC